MSPQYPTPRLVGWLVLPCLLAAGALVACTQERRSSPDLERTEGAVVYGTDDRTDVYASESDLFRDITRQSVVALIRNGDLDVSNPNDIRPLGPTLQQARNLCEDQRFLDQPTTAFCSGTLIDDDLVLTAGHCVETTAQCQGYSYVFDYYYRSEGELETISANDVYGCQELVAHALGGGLDYAILQLDRPVTGPRVPAQVRLEDTPLAAGDNVPVVGFGSGIPAKIDLGGSVLDARAATLDYFVASNDTFGGNSGSGVFTAAGEVVGILVRGETDYVSNGDCNVVNVLPDPPAAGQGEDVTYVARAIEDLCFEANFPSARLCGGPSGEGWCDPCDDADGSCPDGWLCGDVANVEGTQCLFPCEADTDCREDHVCGDDGFCQADQQARCFDGDVWLYDSCGRQLLRADDCGPTEVCSSGACLPRPAGDACTNPTSIEPVTQVLTGDLGAGYFPDTTGSCAGSGPDRVFQFTVPNQVRLEATSTGFDTVLYVRGACDDAATELVCDDDSNPPGSFGSFITATLEPGTYYLFLDAWSSTVGAYTLDLVFDYDFTPPGGDLCSGATEIEPVTQVITGSLDEYADNYSGSCAGAGPERVYSFELAAPTTLTALASGFDTTLYLRSACTDPDTELVCNDDIILGQDRRSQFAVDLDVGTYYLFMDAWSNEVGTYTLELTFEGSCSDLCEVGARRCLDDNRYQVCEVNDLGCSYWETRACGAGLTCEAGACVEDCEDACFEEGLVECFNAASYRECGDFDGDGCLDWSEVESCPAGTFCGDGVCECFETCVEGTRRCGEGNVVEECIATDAVCAGFVPIFACEGGTTCNEGQCVAVCGDGCTESGARRCGPLGGVQVCGQFDDDDCLEWSPDEPCPSGTACDDGECFDVCGDACEPNAERCNGQRIEVCEVSSEGCFVWALSAVCDDDQSCENGVCVDGCTDLCDLGETTCTDDAAGVLTCVVTDTGCTAFASLSLCDDDEICEGGECSLDCKDDCDEGARRCDADGLGIEICEVAETGCTVWSSGPSCEERGGCVEGECVEGCVDECAADGVAECVTSDAYRECSDLDEDGCLEWHLATPCPDDWACVGDGVCTPSCSDDGLEPNNGPDDSLLLDPGEYLDLFVCPDDEDWYAVGVLAGEELVVTVDVEVDLGDVDLELFLDGADGDEPVEVSYGEGAPVERLRYTAEENVVVLLRVFAVEASEGVVGYDLFLTLGGGPDDECELGARRCSETLEGIEKCVLGDDGRLVWSEPDPCGEARTCEDGACIGGVIGPLPDAGGPAIDASSDQGELRGLATNNGCQCAVGAAPGAGGPALGWLLAGLGGLAVLRRRRR